MVLGGMNHVSGVLGFMILKKGSLLSSDQANVVDIRMQTKEP